MNMSEHESKQISHWLFVGIEVFRMCGYPEQAWLPPFHDNFGFSRGKKQKESASEKTCNLSRITGWCFQPT